jgi:hypothetical protein
MRFFRLTWYRHYFVPLSEQRPQVRKVPRRAAKPFPHILVPSIASCFLLYNQLTNKKYVVKHIKNVAKKKKSVYICGDFSCKVFMHLGFV